VIPRFTFPDGELVSWVALGHVTDRSVRVWARLPDGAAEAVLSVDGKPLTGAHIEPRPDRDYVGATVLEVDADCADREFRVQVGSFERTGRFAPRDGTPAPFSFAFGSCHQPFTEELDGGRVDRHDGVSIYPRISDLLRRHKASFAMWLGDQVYSDAVSELSVREEMSKDPSVTDEALVDTYRHLYRGYFNERGFRRLSEEVPAYLMWDDHDIFDGWGSLLDHTAFDERVYAAAERAFVEYQHLRNPGGELSGRPPFGYSFWRGNVGFHVPDLRGERDFNKQRVMGDEGWARLDQFLQEASERGVPTVFLGVSVPVVHASPSLMRALEGLRMSYGRDIRDRWSVPAFAAERTKLVERLFAWQSAVKNRRVIVLSGDVHVGAAFGVRATNGQGRFRQWTSSALSTPDGLKHILANQLITKFVRVGEHELRVNRVGLATSNNVGLVEVTPREDGGHDLKLTVHEYSSRTGKLRVALTDVAR
jgi:alkaline phosphatase D